MAQQKVITPVSVRAISLTDPDNVRVFASLYAAKKALEKEYGLKIHHERIRRDAIAGKELHGFRWELMYPPEPEQKPTEEQADDAQGTEDKYVFTFRENVEAIFAGGKVRVTDETPKRASVYDVIRVITQVQNPHTVLERLRTEHVNGLSQIEFLQFPGERQRPTPVIDAPGLMELVTLLPGKRAHQFRVAACEVLVRYLAGDPTLHAEIEENAEHQAKLPAEHPMRMMTEAVQDRPLNKTCTFLSPMMAGKHVGDYNKVALVYLLRFEHKGAVYTKLGYTRDIMGRMKKHVKELPGCQLYSVFPYEKAEAMEKEFKERYAINRVHVNVEGQVKTELFVDLDISEFEAGLKKIHSMMQQHEQNEQQDKHPIFALQQMFNRALDMVESGKLSSDNKCFDMLLEMHRSIKEL